MALAQGDFTSGEVLPSEKVTVHLNSWQIIGLQILVKYYRTGKQFSREPRGI